MSQALHLEWVTPEQASATLKSRVVPFAGPLLRAGQRLAVTICPVEDDRSIQQNRFYWGVVLKEISDQAQIEGQRWATDAWHELFKRQFLPRKVRKTRVAGKKRPVVTVSIGSTSDLSVRKMSKYMDQVQAFAATDLGVAFTVANWESYQGHRS